MNNGWEFSRINDKYQPQIKEAQRAPSTINSKKSTPRNSIFKL